MNLKHPRPPLAFRVCQAGTWVNPPSSFYAQVAFLRGTRGSAARFSHPDRISGTEIRQRSTPWDAAEMLAL